jgi:hypothetical protein
MGELSLLPTGVLNSMINFHRVEAHHATHIALVHHERAITSRRICDDAFKELSNRIGYADRKVEEPRPMDVQRSEATVVIPLSQEIEIPDASGLDSDSEGSGNESDTRTIKGKTNPSGYHSN